jgi:hypothetical protein
MRGKIKICPYDLVSQHCKVRFYLGDKNLFEGSSSQTDYHLAKNYFLSFARAILAFSLP